MPRRRSNLPPRLSVSQRRVRYSIRRLAVALLAVALGAGIYGGDKAGLFGTRPAPVGEDHVRYQGKSFRVVHVVDGDTVDIDAPDAGRATTRIRLWGVDTPETKNPRKVVQHFGPEAAEFTRRACQGRTVRLEMLPKKSRDKYERLLAYVFLPDGKMINRELVRGGYAYADPRFEHPRKDEFISLQAVARQARLGLWKDAEPKDLPYYMTEKGEGRK
jgi:endonuclease YncB( thermonuclease family)